METILYNEPLTIEAVHEKLDRAISKIRFTILRVSFKALETIHISAYKGSAFRGCLGDALRRIACRYNSYKLCEKCRFNQSCSLSLLYSSPLPANHALFGKYTNPPRPYILNPMPGQQTTIDKDEMFFFDLTLVGSAVEHLQVLVQAFQTMGELGLGTLQSKFEPVKLEHFVPMYGFMPLPVFAPPTEIAPVVLPFKKFTGKVQLRFIHPVRFLSGGEPYREVPSFGMLAENLAQRLALLAHLYCGAEWINTEGIAAGCSNISVINQNLEWKDWIRYSGKQGMKQNYDGHLGTITYTGELAPWQKLLNMGCWLHTGSTATFGLGKYEIEMNG
jgi:hypothetical protein